jgi:hypothetical protein
MAEETVEKPKPEMTGVISEAHAKTLAKLSIIFNDLSTDLRIADTYEDIKKTVQKSDVAMAELAKEFDELEVVLKA